MEETISATPAQIEQHLAEFAPLQVIRTETALSKLPIHNLAKKGNVDINIVRRNKEGEIDLKWIVSYSDRYGQPRQVGYKLDTIVINRRIDEAGRPLPELIRLGSLREIAGELDLGSNTSAVRTALLQNASAFITARLQYKTIIDKRERTLEAGFSRYSVIFTGDQLPSGEKADAVYIELSKRYREVLNNAVFRPLNYDYMRELSPAAQRFYEVVSRPIFAALKYQHAEAKLSYSEYCTCSAQQRYFDYDRFKKQMYKVHRPHLTSGYLKAVRYEPAKDGEGNTDWIMFYTPGPKARAEYHAFTKSGRSMDTSAEARSEIAITARPSKPRATSRQKRFSFVSNQAVFDSVAVPPAVAKITGGAIGEENAAELLVSVDPELVAELGTFGVGETDARKLLASLPPDQPVLDQLDYIRTQIKLGGIKKPAGFCISTLQENRKLPPTFETRQQRKTRLKEEARRLDQQQEQECLELAYGEYQKREIDRYLTVEVSPEELARLTRIQEIDYRKQYVTLPQATIEQMAPRGVRSAISKRIQLLTFEEFCDRERQRPQPGSTAMDDVDTDGSGGITH